MSSSEAVTFRSFEHDAELTLLRTGSELRVIAGRGAARVSLSFNRDEFLQVLARLAEEDRADRVGDDVVGHDSSSVETSGGAENTAAEVEDTVGAHPDAAAGTPFRAVSGIEVHLHGTAPSPPESGRDLRWRSRANP